MADTTHEPPATPAEIWNILRAVSKEQEALSRQQQETERRQQETERMIQETSRQQQETDRRQQETERMIQETSRQQQETERLLKEQSLAADRRLEEQSRETERFLKRQAADSERSLNKLRGVFTSQWGELVESLVQGDLVTLLQGRDVAVNTIHQRAEGRRNGEHYEFDIVAGNGDEVVVTEVKTTLRSEDVAQFLDKLRRFTVYEPRYRGERIYGAVAYLKADAAVTKYAERQGLYVIRATGDSARIVNARDFKPAVFA